MSRVVVIGAGLAGLVAGIRLAREGAHVTVVAKGAGSLPLSPGTIDVLGYAPGRVDSPRAAMTGFTEANPGHPYAHLAPVVDEALEWFRALVPDLAYVGGTEANMLLPTAVGVPRPTALAPASVAAGDLRAGARLVVVGLAALKDFFPSLLADNLRRAELPGGPVEVRHAEVDASPRPGRADVAGQVFARALDDAPFRAVLGDALRGVARDGETIALPAVLGMARPAEALAELTRRAGAPIVEIPTVPPSVPGLRLNAALTAALRAAGGRLVLGPSAVGGEGEGARLTGVRVQEAARTRTLPADAVVLATGGFSAGGIELDSHGALHEVVFDLPVAGPPEGDRGLSSRHLDHQPLMAAGVAVDGEGRPVGPGGGPVRENLWAAGSIVSGALPWREKSGEGIAIAGGYRAASAIQEGT